MNEQSPIMASVPTTGIDLLFRPYEINGVVLRNRLAMAPMTRMFSPSGIPGANVAAYYRRRAEGGIGLIFTEGTYVAHRSSGDSTHVPRLDSQATIDGWKAVTDAVHAAGGRIAAQLWHIGLANPARRHQDPSIRLLGPSGVNPAGEVTGEPMTAREIDAVIEAFGRSALVARRAGFDGVEIHGAHGYLIDQFFWERTNRRTDRWGGNDLAARTRFAAAVIAECRAQAGPDFLISLRFSQWKIGDYAARLAATPDELARFLEPLSDGVDVFHCSTRRFWLPEFEGSDLNLAGWTRKLTGKPTITVGSVTLDSDFIDRQATSQPPAVNLARLTEMMGRGDFDLVALGRTAIANPAWPRLVRQGRYDEIAGYMVQETADTLY